MVQTNQNHNDDFHNCGLLVGCTTHNWGLYDLETADSMIFRRSLANIHRLGASCAHFTPSCATTAYKGGS